MKKLLISLGLSILTIFIICSYKPILIKYLCGNAFILDKIESYTIKIDGKLYKDILFKDKNKFILFLENEKITKDYSIVSIDVKNNVIGFNCSSKDCYDTFLGNLFQSDMGKMYVPFDNTIKGPNFDSNLKISETFINFYIPNKNKRLLIKLNLKETCEN